MTTKAVLGFDSSSADRAREAELDAKHYAPVGKARVVGYRGKHLKAVDWKKNQGEKIGKIPKVLGRTAAVAGSGVLAAGGLALKGVTFNQWKTGRKLQKKSWNLVKEQATEVKKAATDKNEPLIGGKTARFAATAAVCATGVGAVALYASNDLRAELTDPWLKGGATRTVYYEEPKTPEDIAAEKDRNIARLGYDPTDRKSIREYINKQARENPSRVLMIEGRRVVIDNSVDGISRVLVDDMQKPVKGKLKGTTCYNLFDRETGAPFKDPEEMLFHVNELLATRGDFKTEWKKFLDTQTKEIAIKRNKKRDQFNQIDIDNPDSAEMKAIRQEIKDMPKQFVVGRYGIRVYFNPGPNTKMGWTKGILFEFSKATKERLEKIRTYQYKGDLKGEKMGKLTNLPPNSAPFAQAADDDDYSSDSDDDDSYGGSPIMPRRGSAHGRPASGAESDDDSDTDSEKLD